HCHGTFQAMVLPAVCPLCHSEEPQAVAGASPSPNPAEIEGYIPHRFDLSELAPQIRGFVREIPLTPKDLNVKHQLQRLQKLYLPMWWVDAQVMAFWQAEVAFPYEVLSHEETYQAGQWQTKELRETRLKWEWRGGTLERQYDNTPAPALVSFRNIESTLGYFDQDLAKPFQPKAIAEAIVKWPDRSFQEAWQEALYELDQRAQAECLTAADGEQLRSFSWEPVFTDKNWTQLLVPLYATYYEDDRGHKHPLYIHGQTGKVAGVKRASEKKARRRGIGWLSLALMALLSALTAVLAIPKDPLFPGVFVGAAVLFVAGLSLALYVLPRARRFNRRQRDQDFYL
ncbi:MAG: hypothetical protein AAF804_18395, partial [Bacteroidota bacterium]